MVAIGGEEPMQEPGGHGERIYVSVRLRPLNERETARNDVSDWECINDTTIIYRNNLSVSERSMYPTAYTFDRVFGTDCSTRRVYEEGAKKVALSVVSGINTSIFAYGQTSSGKTYTMNGITKYTVADIYDYIETHKEREFVLKFSAIEIYNEAVRDLLSADTTPLRLLDDPERGTTVERLTEETLTDWNHFLELLSVCEAQRQIGETSLNEASSRSHQILRLVIESSAREFLGYDKSSSLTAIVNFVDLAGSERASQTLSAGTRLKEGCHINRSLLTLGTVIRKLSKGRNGHVPYRDSKLTRILQSSLGGNARTAIICTMSPAHIHVEQSRNTLLFASCAKEVTTNAQVNVVMSDKALVKHLQRELTRLESELRCTGPKTVSADSSTLLREKDRQIEKLKKEVADLVLQRDVAQSQVKDLVQVLGEDKPSMVDLERYYPKLRVRNSWDFENQTSGAPVLGFPHRRANSVRSFDTSQYSDGDSRTSSEDTILQLPDFEENFLHTDSSQKLSVSRPNFVDTNLHQEESKEQSDGRSEDLCKEVQCIEMEESSTNRYIVPNTLESSTNRYIVTNTSESSTNGCIVSNASESSTNGRIVSNASESSANTYQNSNMSSPIANTASSGLTMVENGDDTNQEPGSPLLNHEPGSPLLNQTGFVIPSPKKTSQWLPEKDGLMWLPEKVGLIWLPEKDRFCPSVLKLRRSKSCKASLMASLSSCWFEMVEKNESTPPIEFEKYFTGRPESFRKKLPSLKYGSEIERLSRNGSQASARSAAFEESKAQDTESTTDDKGTESSALVEGTKEMTDTQCNTEPADSMVPETDSRLIPSARDVKDVGLDPIPIDVESPSRWPSEFQRLQREIIELWHACNVSLVHRTYFFLLFKGDPSDSIYMEVELRRLSFLKDTFSQGNQTLEDGQTLTPESSMRALARERHMLSKQMRSRLSINERNNLYLKWGIGLNSKNRRWQLANRLWSDTKSIDHITESATVVAKLVGSVQPEQAFKEMFGLRFTPRDTTRKSHRWTESFKSLV